MQRGIKKTKGEWGNRSKSVNMNKAQNSPNIMTKTLAKTQRDSHLTEKSLARKLNSSALIKAQVQVLARLGVVGQLPLVRRKARKETPRPPGRRGILLPWYLVKSVAMWLRLAELENLE